MPSSSFGASTTSEGLASTALMSSRHPPPVTPRALSVSVQPWQAPAAADSGYGSSCHARSASMDSLESSGSNSSGSGGGVPSRGSATDAAADYIAARTVLKTPKLPSHNPLQFVKVQSPLYKKAEQQIQLTKEVKITREALKEGEEEWQSVCMPTSTDWTFNLDNWKSRRRKVSEKVIQRAEEMRQIEAEEQLRQEQYQQQQRKIKKFSEIVEKRSSSRSYNLDLYIAQGDDSGLGGTPEPDDTVDSHSSILRSDTSEGMTSEAESIDSDIHKAEKMSEKEPPKVPQKPQSRLHRNTSIDESDSVQTSAIINFSDQLPSSNLSAFDNFSSTEPSDVEGHCGDNETVSSEEDMPYLADNHKPPPLLKIQYDQNEDHGISGKINSVNAAINQEIDDTSDIQIKNGKFHSFNISIKSGDNRGFGFTLKGGKDQRCPPYIDSITKYSAADMIGLKEGDQIIFLNGEKATESSHASLIFSVKQAVYTGVLDVMISRSLQKGHCFPESQTKSSNKKSSFAEKLALFSSDVNGANTNSEENNCPTTTKNDDNKTESLVLRRRSAFENGRNENYISKRRSSCLTQGSHITNTENVEKRLSVDLALSQFNIQENGSVKKGPPPPVPVKPKMRPKAPQNLLNTESEKVNVFNICLENSDSISPNSILDKCLSEDNQTNISFAELSLIETRMQTSMEEVKLEKDNVESILNDTYNNHSDKVELSQIIQNSICDHSIKNNHDTFDYNINDVSGNDSSDIYKSIMKIDTILENVAESENSDLIVFEGTLSFSTDKILPVTENDAINMQKKEAVCEDMLDIPISKKPVSESLITISFTSTENSFYDNETQKASDSANICSELKTEVVSSEDVKVAINQLDSNFAKSLTDEVVTCNEENAVPFDMPNVKQLISPYEISENICDVGSLNDFAENMNSDSAEEIMDHTQINPSPLCLPLEKIDEDDVISASTTTSSETPDTETVIETLPSNVSPLPNDESNGEESSKTSNSQERLRNHVAENSAIETSCIDFDIHGQDHSSECLKTFVNVPNKEACTPNSTKIDQNNTCMYAENEDDEYCIELDESLDQITSLDVIDEIEQRLMHQLEHQGDTFVEMDKGLTSQLEDDINKQWLYFAEEADLLDDLTPRNSEPPSEPPPPPPPAEIDDSEQQLIPVDRSNSTKRIKKELWRRRSDFLGLDSPAAIDVDNLLPPPPPGLEEILKQEREQNQWLEKRLFLAESEISSSLYMSEPVSVEPQYNQGEYSQYFLEEDLSTNPIGTQSKQWKENLDEDSTFEPSYDSQYVPLADVPSPASEETRKIEESPQRKAKQNIHNLGVAPKAKIVDSNKWITEQVIPVSKKSIEPVFHQTTYNQNYWLAQDDEKRRIVEGAQNVADRRLSMPQFPSHHPDVTIRTWDDREYEFQKQRPRSALWNSSANNGDGCDPFSHSHKQDVLRSHSLDSHRENCDTDTLESEVHNCSSCGNGLCEGSAMGIEALGLYFHIECFRCSVCCMQLGNGSCGTDVQVKNNWLYCPHCFTVD